MTVTVTESSGFRVALRHLSGNFSTLFLDKPYTTVGSSMDSGLFQSLSCVACGRDFVQLSAYSNHVRTCRSQKKRTANALEAAKETYRNKRMRLTTNQAQLSGAAGSSQELEASNPAGATEAAAEVSVPYCPISDAVGLTILL